jgi:hypothetical protein
MENISKTPHMCRLGRSPKGKSEIYIETNRVEPQGSLKTIAVKIQEHPRPTL